MFYVLKENEIVGGVGVAACQRLVNLANGTRMDKRAADAREELKVSRVRLLGMTKYFIALICSVPPTSRRIDYVRDIFDIDLEATLNTFFAPEVSLRQVGFIPWNCGYLAMVTTPDCEKIESIQFFRKGPRA